MQPTPSPLLSKQAAAVAVAVAVAAAAAAAAAGTAVSWKGKKKKKQTSNKRKEADLANHNRYQKDDAGWTPLMISASVPEGEDVLSILLHKGAHVNETNTSGQTALHFVASKKNLDVARILLESAHPPASTRVRDRRGQYPIHRAAAVGSVPMVRLLLQCRSPLNAADNEGYTPLHHAVAEGHAIALLKEGADFTLKTAEEVVALDLAPDSKCRRSHFEIQVRRFIVQAAEREGIELSDAHLRLERANAEEETA
ncbi:Ankyrin repeat-containing domain protein [Moelleriella libera RCEF 2490]|uniref:Ankyrin repeat-containing domain protein n=1 Tax=Moelleriella libera RCEF 2490 TaxID=1081109 RepID=A0A168B5A6_9HYPO|nr:Ankyrin repeat-containing domain protein [Moelleriella libera RCEF 2490]